ncbi:MAG: cation:proton antiporter [Kiritimatiellia bacterium]|nr:cation:proton antiporter [Lentisphaerota bacterium]
MKKKAFAIMFLAITTITATAATATEQPVALTHHMMMLMLQLGVIIFAAKFGGLLFQRLKIPGVLGELCAGMLIGPFLLGQLALPGLPQGLFPPLTGFPLSNELYGICSLAAIILLFITGLETDLKLFIRFSLAGTAIGIGGVLLSFGVGALTVMLLDEYIFGEQLGFFDPRCLFLGVFSTATSVGITARILSEKHKLSSPEGVTIIAGAVIDDVLGIILLAVVLGYVGALRTTGTLDWGYIGIIAVKTIGIWIVSTVLALLLARRVSTLLKLFRDQTTIAIMALGLALILAGLFEEAGLAMIIGAYVAGLSLSQTDISRVVQERLDPVQKLLVPVFFCCMGMLVDFKELSSTSVIVFGLIYTLGAVAAKLLGCGLPALLFRFNPRGALRIGMGMVPRGEVALIIAGIGLAWDILRPQEFGVAVMMTVLTTLIAPVLLAWLFNNPTPGTTREVRVSNRKNCLFAFPSAEITEVLLGKLIDAFNKEGFYAHDLDGDPEKVYQLRQLDTIIELRREGPNLIFECEREDEHIVNSAVFETTTELRSMLNGLNMPIDQDALQAKFSQSARIDRKRAFDLGAYISPARIAPNLQAGDRDAVLDELLNLLLRQGCISKKAPIMEALLERENTFSTGLPGGFAMPHARTNQVEKIVCAVGVSRGGIDFNAMDGKPSHIFALELAPQQAAGPHLRFVAAITQTMQVVGPRLLQERLDATAIHRLLTQGV